MVAIPGTEELVLNEVVNVTIEAAAETVTVESDNWHLGYALTVHSSQGFTDISRFLLFTLDCLFKEIFTD
jgi:hypothetical protein